jgi:hypothetical protein
MGRVTIPCPPDATTASDAACMSQDGLRLSPTSARAGPELRLKAAGLYRSRVFNIGQRTAVEGAFRLAGFSGRLVTAPVTSPEERIFMLRPADLEQLRDVRALEQILQQLLGMKVAVCERTESCKDVVPFE